ncbi:porin [Roseomonas elaeocarpi]|uniref:Porin n=1 Tax=Roseomonas elaeocarpi TaxID=907779 RepID=A0ABV6JY70_9PROT
MRKLLLGSTAVAAAALMTPQGAKAQGADPFLPAGPPMVSHRALEVRVGGYFRFNYSYTDEGQNQNNTDSRPGAATVSGPFTTTSTGVNAGTNGANQTTVTNSPAVQTARRGKSDLASDAEIHIVANGKATNGLRYGVAMELEVDYNNANYSTSSGTRAAKTAIDTDEMWMYIAGDFGQFRFGDEDNVINLMSVGHVANFGTGGMDGDQNDTITTNSRFATTWTSDTGDNTKIIYMSPQFFGFDFGGSFAFNTGEGEDTGCNLGYVTSECDSANAFTGSSPRRRNEVAAIVRWRGSFGGVGLQAAGGLWHSDVTKVLGVTSTRGIGLGKEMNVGYAAAQATAYGFTVGGEYYWGSTNATFNPLVRSDISQQNLKNFFGGISYTIGPVTVGANYARQLSAGSQSVAAVRQEGGWAIGATYVLAPGLSLVADFVDQSRKERGFNFSTASAGASNNRADVRSVLIGTRIAF